MKILILSCSTGEGHNSAAYALKEAFERYDAECSIVDPVSFRSDKAKKNISNLYNGLIRKSPRAFGAVYKVGDVYSKTGILSPVYLYNASYSKKLNDYIIENKIDAVVCTHLYGMEAMRAAKKRHGSTTPTFGVFTDYTCIPFIKEAKCDKYFVPHESIKQELANLGVDENTIEATGIPVSKRFRDHTDKHTARQILNIPENKKIYLIMSGGVGCENLLKLCEKLTKESGDFLAYVITGHNQDLFDRIKENFSDSNLVPVGFTDKINLYMRAADVMISKAGGLSSTEAAVANVPLIHFKSIPGCESKNTEFFSQRHMSINAKNDEEVISYAYFLSHNQSTADAMTENQKNTINANAADDIVKSVIEEITRC